MRIVQRTFLYLVSILLIAAGAAAAAYPFSQRVVDLAHKVSGNWMLCLLVGCASAALGLFTLLPFDRFQRKGRGISFGGPTGTVSIQIDPFETSLRKTIAKLPMVKRVAVTVTPKDNDRKVAIEATVSLQKPADASTRETAERLRDFIDKVSRQVLGADEVMTVDVRVEDVLIDPTQTAESLNSIFATAEKSVKVESVEKTAAPSAAAVAVAAPIAAAQAAQEFRSRSIAEDAEDDADAAGPDSENDGPHSTDLLTYDEVEELRHARLSDKAVGQESGPAGGDESNVTSFESLADDIAQDGAPKSEAKE
jgi:hypothetical protein